MFPNPCVSIICHRVGQRERAQAKLGHGLARFAKSLSTALRGERNCRLLHVRSMVRQYLHTPLRRHESYRFFHHI